MLGKWEKPLLLAPTKTLPKEAVEKKLKIEVSYKRRKNPLPLSYTAPIPYPTPRPTPRFDSIFAIISLISAIALKWRLSNGRRN